MKHIGFLITGIVLSLLFLLSSYSYDYNLYYSLGYSAGYSNEMLNLQV
jgi:hypothetical protein